MSSWDVYWMLRCDDIRSVVETLFVAFLVSSIVVTGVLFVLSGPILGSSSGQAKRAWRRATLYLMPMLWLVVLVTTLASALIPTTKQMAVIYVVPRMVNYAADNDELRGLPAKVLGLANEWVEELSPKKGAPKTEGEVQE